MCMMVIIAQSLIRPLVSVCVLFLHVCVYACVCFCSFLLYFVILLVLADHVHFFAHMCSMLVFYFIFDVCFFSMGFAFF